MARIGPNGRGFLAGVVGGAAVLATSALISLAAGTPPVVELVWDSAVGFIPAPLFSAAIDSLKYAAKPLFLLGLTALQLLLAGLLGAVYALTCGAYPFLSDYARRRRLLLGVAYGLLLCGIALAIGVPFLKSGSLPTWGAALTGILAFALLQAELFARLDTSDHEGEPPKAVDLLRRDLLVKVVTGAIALSAIGILLKTLLPVGQGVLGIIRSSAKKVSSYITPNNEFYQVSKNLQNPRVEAKSWRLEVKGSVANPLELTLEDLRSLPPVTQFTTLECISNEVGGDLMGNAVWLGVPLRDLLAKAGVLPEAVEVVLHAADGYADSIPADKAMDPGTLVAYQMNGEPLPPDHGFPARLIVPGIYGMKNVKWLTGVEPVARDFKGFWQQEGWSDSAVVKTTSRIDTPGGGEEIGGEISIAGVAFAGDRGISRVEVSFDSVSWHQAILSQTASPYTWVLWTSGALWARQVPAARPLTLTVRAVDGNGALQDSAAESPFPDGASGYHRISVR